MNIYTKTFNTWVWNFSQEIRG